MMTLDRTTRKRIYLAQLGAYLFVVCAALAGFAQIEQNQNDIENSQRCTEIFLTRTAKVAEDRVGISAEVQAADRAQEAAWAGYVRLQLRGATGEGPQADLEEQIRYVKDYFAKLQHYLEVIEKEQEARLIQPFPDRAEYRKCLAGDTNDSALYRDFP